MNKLKLFTLLMFSSTFILTSCGGGGNGKKGGGTTRFVSKTGWKPNEQNGWFFSGKQQKGWPGMVYVEGGTFTMGLVKDDVMRDWNNTPRRMQVTSFYLGETEITNYEYREYVTWLKFVFPPSNPDYKEIYNGALPNTSVWNNELSRNDFAETYFYSPQYDYYPVVGVSWLQASRYCDWLTDRANEKVLMQQGVISKNFYKNESNNLGANSFSLDKFKENDPDTEDYINTQRLKQRFGIKTTNQRIIAANKNVSDGVVSRFRLPTEVEWEFAALGMEKERKYNMYLNKKPAIEQLKSQRKKDNGKYLDNFKIGSGDYSGAGGWENGSSTTSDVKQYPSNNLGLYGMFGNVAEWTADVYRPIIDQEASDFNYYRGNVVQEVVKNADGTFRKIVNPKYDTLADGRLLYRGLPGQYEREVVADNRNFKDGDFQSSLDAGYGRGEDSTTAGYNMYNSKQKRFIVDGRGRVVLQKDPVSRTTRVSNEVRVIKGGSWLDGAYWLDPGQRRYRDEAKAYGWVGFRVAQDAKSAGKGRTKR
ncbi:gliding motility lipoprotein GldJ [Kaistella montana]|uniref:Gliding motility lipoprotein GldJ n=1 Tax=Kaistella montana TaxID=1849733 RepID=A0ABW5K617_9FLAO|nr:gliding motility lipoprotein GldJ [Kaistella montana]MCQ4034396.1 gliding motility lipoprotein GldJ [Kaistella montana]